jgi:ABC-2 type transport system permease protein
LRKFLFIVFKESIQLIRDLPGLTILFLMPALMLILITLTQEKVIIGIDSGLKIILVNADSSILGYNIEKEILTNINPDYVKYSSEKEAERAVFTGKFQLMIVIPRDATEKLITLARQQTNGNDTIQSAEIDQLVGITLLYDPAVMKIYKDMLVASIQALIESEAMEIYLNEYSAILKDNISKQFDNYKTNLLSADFENEMPDFPNKKQIVQQIKSGIKLKARDSIVLDFPDKAFHQEKLVRFDQKTAGSKLSSVNADLVRNNVPAFILFAMFFIVIPLAGSIINEKQQGTKDRLMTLPVSGMTFLSGKVTIYLIVCIMQFFVMIFIGRFVFPLISKLPALSLDVNWLALMTVVVASGLAAIGFGLLTGILSSTNGQAATLGSVMVVILAVLGGIFVPSYMMPDVISKISIISPLRWGTDAFFNIFARGSGVNLILPQVFSLFVFFGISLFFSMKAFNQRK